MKLSNVAMVTVFLVKPESQVAKRLNIIVLKQKMKPTKTDDSEDGKNSSTKKIPDTVIFLAQTSSFSSVSIRR